jgi:Zn-dependent peptidase ImmA (M78 family)
MRKPRSTKVSIYKTTFVSIKDHFNIEKWLKERHNIEIEKEVKEGEKLETTISRLRQIAEYLKIPVSLFFMKECPPFPPLPNDFRSRRAAFTKNTINAFRQAYFYQEILNQLTADQLLFTEKYSIHDDPKEVATHISEILKFEKLRQKNRNTSQLFLKIRTKLEEFNIYTFKEDFPVEETRGFSLSDEFPPIIIINRGDCDEAKIFTILHEFGHILLEKPGISEPSSMEFNTNNPIEIWCNQFAGSILIPAEIIKNIFFQPNENIGNLISSLSKQLFVSKHSLAYAFLKENKINRLIYSEYISRPFAFRKPEEKGEFRIKREVMIKSMKGKKFTSTIMEAYRSHQLSQSDVREILSINDNDKAFNNLLKTSRN